MSPLFGLVILCKMVSHITICYAIFHFYKTKNHFFHLFLLFIFIYVIYHWFCQWVCSILVEHFHKGCYVLLYRKVEQIAEEAESLRASLDKYNLRNQKRMREANERTELLGRAVCCCATMLLFNCFFIFNLC